MTKAWMIIWAAIVIHIASFYLMLQGVEPISTDFYVFAWWTYIVFLSGVNHLRGRNSLLLDNPREFVWVFLYSVPVWLFFEIYNFSLNNWHYIGIPVETYLRWPGYAISFGTVLPGVFETETFLKNFGVLTRIQGRPIRVTPGLLFRFVIAGLLIMLFIPLRPDFFFPLVWVGCIFLLDPLIYWSEQRHFSFLGNVEQGNYAIMIRLLATGMICGLLWEFWNYWASAKWVYTVPHVGFLKIFEMPMLGFFGFPPFALECYLLYRGFVMFRQRFIYGRKFIPLVTTLLVIIYCILAFMGIDRFTVETYKVTTIFSP